MDTESRLLRQSATSAERGAQRKDHCLVRKSNSDFQMKKSNMPLSQNTQSKSVERDLFDNVKMAEIIFR